MGRPSDYTQEIANIICEQIATTAFSIKTICINDERLPAPSTIFRWLTIHTTFQEQYARAKEQQAEVIAEEMLEIADDGSNDFMTITSGKKSYNVEDKEVTNRSKLRLDTRKWLLSKLLPKKYGDKIDHTTGGEKIPAANILSLPTDKLAQLEKLLSDANS